MTNPDVIAAIARLSGQADYSAYTALCNALDAAGPEGSGCPALRVAVLRNFTFEPILPVLKGEIALAGFHPQIFQGGFDTIAQDVLNPQSELYAFQPDVVIIAQWLETLSPQLATRFVSLSPELVQKETERIVSETGDLLQALRRQSKAPVLINTFPLPTRRTLGILDAQSRNYQGSALLRLNDLLGERLRQIPDVYIVDYLHLLARIGGTQGIDERYWHIGRAPIGRHAIVPFGQEYGKYIRALRGRNRKCLVLDCDNILWGGVLGEEGPEGIKLGSTYPGSCYQAFQREILNLHDRGVLVALCSKNNETDVMEVVRRHPDMLLRENHISAFQINWEDKATNLRRIAKDLNIGLESLVFIDDNAFECDWVRDQLPEVAVLQLASEPSGFSEKLMSAGYFDSLVFSGEDRQRSRLYAQDKERKALQTTAHSLEDYLTKLEMVADISRLNKAMIPRISQLTQKTNQFNLTTRRYTEGEIQALQDDPAAEVFGLSLRDRVSDMGLVGAAILRYGSDKAEIETFLLSCRVLGRGVEQALLAHLMASAKEKGCQTILGRYRPTAKNEQTATFYKQQGFQPVGENPNAGEWETSLGAASVQSPRWIAVKLNESEEKSCKPMNKN